MPSRSPRRAWKRRGRTWSSSRRRTRRPPSSPRGSSSAARRSSTSRERSACATLRAYPAWYGFEHPAPALLGEAVYGLTEWCGEELAGRAARREPRLLSRRPSSSRSSPLAAAPRDRPARRLRQRERRLGRGEEEPTSPTRSRELAGNFKAYGVGVAPARAGDAAGAWGFRPDAPFVFVPHLLPVVRGILSTLHVSFAQPHDRRGRSPRRTTTAYAATPFVRVRPAGELPELRDVVGTPRAEIGFALLPGGRRGVLVSAIDNLLKGAASAGGPEHQPGLRASRRRRDSSERDARGRPAVVKLGGSLLEDAALRARALAAIAAPLDVGRAHRRRPRRRQEDRRDRSRRSGSRRRRTAASASPTPRRSTSSSRSSSGLVNKSLVAELRALGVTAAGLSGADGETLVGRVPSPPRRRGLRVRRAASTVLEPDAHQRDPRRRPPARSSRPSRSGARATLLNVNADSAASALAVALGAEKLVFLTDVEGLLDADGKRRRAARPDSRGALLVLAAPWRGGMRPKLVACLEARRRRASAQVVIAGPNGHASALADGIGGTRLVAACSLNRAVARREARTPTYILGTYARTSFHPRAGKGAQLVDADGKVYWDLLAGIAVNALGYRHPRLVKALREEADRPPPRLEPLLPPGAGPPRRAAHARSRGCRAPSSATAAPRRTRRRSSSRGSPTPGRAGSSRSRAASTGGRSARSRSRATRRTGRRSCRSSGRDGFVAAERRRGARERGHAETTSAIFLEPIHGRRGHRPALGGVPAGGARRGRPRGRGRSSSTRSSRGLGRTGHLFVFQELGRRARHRDARQAARRRPAARRRARRAADRGAREAGPPRHDVRRQPGRVPARPRDVSTRSWRAGSSRRIARRASGSGRSSRSAKKRSKGRSSTCAARGLMWGIELDRDAAAVQKALLAEGLRRRDGPRRRCCASSRRTSFPARPCPDSSRRSRRSSAKRRRRRCREQPKSQEGRPRLLRRARHVDHHPLAQGELRLRGRRGRGRRRPGRGDRRPRGEGAEDRRVASSTSSTRRRSSRREYLFPRPARRAPSTSTTTCSARRRRGRSSRKKQVEIALATGCDALAHGCTGKGNDQVRFELAYQALAPELGDHRAVARVGRSARARTRSTTRRRADIPVPVTKKDPYSRDRNLWHISHEGGPLEDPAFEPEESMFKLTVDPEKAPDEPERVTIALRGGLPGRGQRRAALARPRSSRRSTRSAAATASAASTSSRTGSSASSRAASTRRRAARSSSRRSSALETLTLDRDSVHEKERLAAPLRRARLLRAVVLAAARGARRVHRDELGRDRHGRRHAEALQGLGDRSSAGRRRTRSTRRNLASFDMTGYTPPTRPASSASSACRRGAASARRRRPRP